MELQRLRYQSLVAYTGEGLRQRDSSDHKSNRLGASGGAGLSAEQGHELVCLRL